MHVKENISAVQPLCACLCTSSTDRYDSAFVCSSDSSLHLLLGPARLADIRYHTRVMTQSCLRWAHRSRFPREGVRRRYQRQNRNSAVSSATSGPHTHTHSLITALFITEMFTQARDSRDEFNIVFAWFSSYLEYSCRLDQAEMSWLEILLKERLRYIEFIATHTLEDQVSGGRWNISISTGQWSVMLQRQAEGEGVAAV